MNQLPAWLPQAVRDAHGAWFVVPGAVLGAVALLLMLREASRSRWFRRHVWHSWVTAGGVPRCPECRYSMVGTESLRCPECGHVAGSVADLLWARARPRVAVIAAVVLLPMAVGLMMMPEWRRGRAFEWLPTPAMMMLEGAVGVGTVPQLTRTVRGRVGEGLLHSPWQVRYAALHHHEGLRFRDRWPAGVEYRLEVTGRDAARHGGFRVVAPTFIAPTEADRSYFESFLMPVRDTTIRARLIDGRLPLKATLAESSERGRREVVSVFYVPITVTDSLAEAMTPVRSAAADEILGSSLRVRFADVSEMSSESSEVTPMWRMMASLQGRIAQTLPEGTVLAVRVEVVDVAGGDKVLASSEFRFEPGYLRMYGGKRMSQEHRFNTPQQSVVKGDMSFFGAVARGERDAAGLAIRIRADEMGALTAFDATAYWDGEIRLPLLPTIENLKPKKAAGE